MHIHLLHWFLDFIGVHNGEDVFSTRMYNFWSGFGGNISVLALIGTVFGVYRHNLKRFNALNALNPLNYTHKKDKE
jgi:hypothetical protein